MHRIPEPELMQDPAQAAAYAAADFSESAAIFVQAFRKHFPTVPAGAALLDLGCGPANLPLRLAEFLPELSVHALDGAQPMLDIALRRWSAAGRREQLRPLCDHLPSARLPAAFFDVLVSRSLLHHLADPGVLWSTLRQTGKPGAAVLVMDLVRPDSEDQARRLTAAHVAGEHPLLQDDFYHSLLAAYEVEEVRAQIAASDLDLQVTQVSDRHWLAAGRL